MATDFTIVSKPDRIPFECPQCGCEAEVPFKEVGAPAGWSDNWPELASPICDKPVQLGDWDHN